MAKIPSLYEVASREVSPVADLLKSVVEVNWHLMAATNLGWIVELDVSGDDGQLMVEVKRSDCWPNADAEAEYLAEAERSRTPPEGKEIPGGQA